MENLNEVSSGKRGRPKKEEIATEELKQEIKEFETNKTAPGVEPVKAEIQVEEPEYKIEIVRDYYGAVDPFYLARKNPNYAYRFIRDEHKNISNKTTNMLFQKGAWQLVDRKHALSIGMTERDISPDGLIRRGDTVLAFMPKKVFDEKEKYKQEMANRPVSMVKRLVKDGDKDRGGKDIHKSMKGLQTQEALRM